MANNTVKAAPKKNSQAKEVWRRFKKNKLAVAGLVIIFILIIAAILAPVIAPYGYDDQDYSATLIRFSKEHLLGTDNLGRDILSRLLYGSRVSLTIGFISVGIGLVIGGLVGAISGYYGGVLDDILMRIVDIIMAIPSIILAISICAALGPGLINTMIAVGISSIPNYARILRSSILSIKQQEFVEAATAIGASDARIIAKHIIPNSLSGLIVQASMGVGRAIISAASMSFVGLGIQPPNPEWGAMLSFGRTYFRDYGYMVLYPGLFIFIAVLSMNLIGDGLRDALDPRLKR
ncbi:MAG: ABC transporter permease [Clostridia bacterium]|jgi:peptide/nickel transport system permease protein|nr:ABC transporter permease [Clostridia bacterium]